MEFRMANIKDLPEIKKVYNAIIKDMDNKGIPIWDEVYPCEFFEQDIVNNNLYVLFDDNNCLASAFALVNGNAGDNKVTWKYNAKNPVYIDRLGVNPNNARQGIGKIMLKNAISIAEELGADSLRLFVVDINKPAISLYEKAGFVKADGIYNEAIDEDYTLQEYGYEHVLGKACLL